jgi:hypothetical protein
MCYALAVEAFGEANVLKSFLPGKDSVINLQGDSGDQSFILHKGEGIISVTPQIAKSPSHAESMILDAPTNDSCVNAITISDGDSIEYNALEATFDGPGDVIITPNIWYKYTSATTGPVRIQLDNFGANDFPHMAVYDGWSCPQYVSVPPPMQFSGGETIANASPLPSTLPASYSGTLEGFSHNYDLPCAQQNNAEDAVYSFTSPINDTITLSLCPFDTLSWIPLLGIMDATGNVLVCSKDYEWYQTYILNFPVTANETYYILVSSCFYVSGEYRYILTVTSPDYHLIDFPLRQLSNIMRLNFDAIAGHQYLIELGSRAMGGIQFPLSTGYISIGPAPAMPPNDDCENATDGGVLAPGNVLTFTGDNFGATPDCPAIGDLPEIWVKFTTEEEMDVRVDYCGTTSIEDNIYMALALSNSCPCGPTCRVSGELDMSTPFLHCPNSTLNVSWYHLPAGIYYYPMVLTAEMEGLYQINITGSKKQLCSSGVIYGQRPGSLSDMEAIDFIRSEEDYGEAVAAMFSTSTTDTIDQITWWGINSSPYGNTCPLPDSFPFKIIFCNVNGPYPQDTVVSYIVNLAPEFSGYLLSGEPQMKFVFDLNPPVILTNGWVIIQCTYEDDCYFMWQTSPQGSSAVQYVESEQQWQSRGLSVAFCLNGIEGPQPECSYILGDINGDGQRIGGDVTYGVRYFKGTGGVPPDSCYMDSTSTYLYVSGDVNGNCEFRGSDITRLVAFFKGTAQLSYCHFFPSPILRNNQAISPKLSGEN